MKKVLLFLLILLVVSGIANAVTWVYPEGAVKSWFPITWYGRYVSHTVKTDQYGICGIILTCDLQYPEEKCCEQTYDDEDRHGWKLYDGLVNFPNPIFTTYDIEVERPE